MNMQLQRFGPEPALVISAAAVETRNDAIADAKDVREVDSPGSQELAASALRGLRLIEKECENDRKAIKQPVRRLGELIDMTVQTHLAPVQAEIIRLNQLMSAYQESERKKHMAALQAQREAEWNIERERQAALREAEENERKARLEAEEELRKAKDEETARLAEMKRANVEKEAEEARARANEEANQARLETARAVAAAAPARAEGLVVQDSWQFEILDLELVRQHRPDFVRSEPNRAAILSAIRGGLRKCPGLMIWSETKTTVRT